MIKAGRSLEQTVADINNELNNKVDVSTSVAGISLRENIPAEDLTKKLFHFTPLIASKMENGVEIKPHFLEYEQFDNCAPDIIDWGES